MAKGVSLLWPNYAVISDITFVSGKRKLYFGVVNILMKTLIQNAAPDCSRSNTNIDNFQNSLKSAITRGEYEFEEIGVTRNGK